MDTNTKHQQVQAFLKQHHMGVLSTVSGASKPWGSAIYFVVDEAFNVFFVTRQETYKYQNLEQNPYAALTVVDEASQTTVQLAGNISKVPAKDYMDVVFTKLAALRPTGDSNWAPPIERIQQGDYMPLQLIPSTLQYADFGKQTNDYDHRYVEKIL